MSAFQVITWLWAGISITGALMRVMVIGKPKPTGNYDATGALLALGQTVLFVGYLVYAASHIC